MGTLLRGSGFTLYIDAYAQVYFINNVQVLLYILMQTLLSNLFKILKPLS